MPLDAVFLKAMVSELAGQLPGLKIDKIQQPERDQVLLTLRGPGATERLLISAGTGDARVHLTDASFENPASPPMFCMLLRKHLGGARIKSVTQPTLERAVDLTLECVDALGEPGEKHLVAELMGRYSNIILTDSDGRIIDCLRRVDTTMSERRQVLPGLFYHLPPPQDKRDLLTVKREDVLSLISQASPDKAADKWLIDTFAGLSPLVARELTSCAYGDTDSRLGYILTQDGGEALAMSIMTLTEDIRDSRFEPVLLLKPEGKPFDFSFMAIRQYGDAMRTERPESFSALLETFYTRRFSSERMRQRSLMLTKMVRIAHDRVKRKLEFQRMDLDKSKDRERLRELGDIITANLHRIEKGMAVLKAEDFYSETGDEVEIRLDPKLTPQQNAGKYYKDYTKAKTAENMLQEQMALGERELAYLKSVLEEIARAEGERDLAEIRQELAQTGYVRQPAPVKTGRPGKTAKRMKQPESSPMRFVSSMGLDIAVGRNNVQNERLTHREAFKTDIWLHAQKIPGSHVIISTNGGDADDQTLEEAASLAAWFSQARESGKVPVDTSLVKYVKKMPGGRPGMVTYTDYKTIIAAPSEALAEMLRKK